MFEVCMVVDWSNWPEALVAVNSIQTHNPGWQVRIFHPTSIPKVKFSSVKFERINDSDTGVLEAVDYYIKRKKLDRVLIVNPNVVCQTPLNELETMDLGECLMVVQNARRFYFEEKFRKLYRRFDSVREERRNSLNVTYYDTGVMMFNLPALRKRLDYGLLYGYRQSGFDDPDEYINYLLRAATIIVFPSNMDTITEDAIYNHLPNKVILRHHMAMKYSRLLHFVGDVVPWKKGPFNKRRMQFPMEQYQAAMEPVRNRLPASFVEAVDENTRKMKDYLGKLPEAFFEFDFK